MEYETYVKTRSKQFIDPDTMEYVTGAEIYEAIVLEETPQARFEWVKLYLNAIPRLREVVNSQSFNVVCLLFSKMKTTTNVFTCSRTQAAVESGVSRSTVNRLFDGLFKADLIRYIERSDYMINPQLTHAGNRIMDKSLLLRYSKLPQSDKRTKKLAEDRRKNAAPLTALEKRINQIIEGGCADGND